MEKKNCFGRAARGLCNVLRSSVLELSFFFHYHLIVLSLMAYSLKMLSALSHGGRERKVCGNRLIDYKVFLSLCCDLLN